MLVILKTLQINNKKEDDLPVIPQKLTIKKKVPEPVTKKMQRQDEKSTSSIKKSITIVDITKN